MGLLGGVLWWVFGLVSFAFAAVGLAGYVTDTRKRWVGVVIFTVIGAVGMAATGLASDAHNQGLPVPWWSMLLGTRMVIAGGCAISILIFVRLAAFKHFGGSFIDLDFGRKYSSKQGHKIENLAFEFEFNTFGHFVQGLLVVLVYPPVQLMLTLGGHPLITLGDIASMLVVVYPVYNGIKRNIKHAPHFAISSFFNNCLEWVAGFLLGNALGVLSIALADLWGADEIHADRIGRAGGPWDIAQMVVGCLLMLVVAIATVQLVRTWNVVAGHSYGVVTAVATDKAPTDEKALLEKGLEQGTS